jgi:mRNA interferase MazF
VLSSNLRIAEAPGNVRLKPGEARLPKPSVVNVSQIYTVDRTQLARRIGTLTQERVAHILEGIELLLRPSEVG